MAVKTQPSNPYTADMIKKLACVSTIELVLFPAYVCCEKSYHSFSEMLKKFNVSIPGKEIGPLFWIVKNGFNKIRDAKQSGWYTPKGLKNVETSTISEMIQKIKDLPNRKSKLK